MSQGRLDALNRKEGFEESRRGLEGNGAIMG